MSHLSKEAVEAHSKDPTAYGPLKPLQSAFLVDDAAPFDESSPIPRIKTLALHWDFNQVTGSGPSSAPTVSDATFFVEDISAEGSQPDSSKYSWVGASTGLRHTGKGDYFLGNDTGSVNTEFLYTAKQLQPEVINSSDMIEVRSTDDDNLFTRETRPLDYFYMIEKSPSAIISDEMIKIFATINDFNSLIGDPVNRCRQNYKDRTRL